MAQQFIKIAATKEETLYSAWLEWQKQPSKESFSNFLKVAQPIINQVINSYFGPEYIRDPLLQGAAKTIIYQTLPHYDASKGSLTQFIWINLQRLQRYLGKFQTTIRTSEGNIMLAKQIQSAKQELEEQLGREPTIMELADYLKVSPKRIKLVTQMQNIGYTSSFERGISESGGWLPEKKTQTSLTDKFLNVIYETLDSEQDRAIMEYAYGLNFKPKLKVVDIASKLKVSPALVSRTIGKIESKLRDLNEMWSKTGEVYDDDLLED
jgi:DNA-directed RNA polymerase specialized sigma subunit